jgi:ABC-type glycerol-3-phosphate transport system permease component
MAGPHSACGALAGFGFAKYRFPGRTILFYFVICTLMIPFQVLVVPLFIEVKGFGWENSYAGLITPGLMNAFGVFMMRQYASDLPTSCWRPGASTAQASSSSLFASCCPCWRRP